MSDVPSERKKQVMEHDAGREESIYLVKDRANIAYDAGDYAEALRYFQQLNQITSEPLRTPLLHKYGVCLAREGKKDEALAVFNRAVKEGRDSLYDVLSGLEKAVILLQKGKKEDALDALKKAKELDSKTFNTYSRKIKLK
ncbi:tetratricopeptide repeat protein [Candidatus Aerophobetes bacterium]|nr:tetratricopeptide repeat protein [Candidatus Aerophobetes bacterium]